MLDAARPRPRTTAPGRTRLVAAHLADHRGRIALITVLAVLVALLVPFALASSKAHADSHDPMGSLDSVTVTSTGAVELYGWAADIDNPTAPLRVIFYDNGKYQIAFIARGLRYDVAAAYPQFGAAHGYTYDLNLPDGTHQICVTAANLGAGADAQLGCQSVTVHNSPTGTAAAATVKDNTATITGTASDPNTTSPVIVRVYSDGLYAGGTSTGPGNTFSLSFPVAEGSHAVCLYALNVGPGANLQFGCQTVVVHNNPFGSLDNAGQVPAGLQVSGWALDLNTTGSVLVRAYVDNRHVADQIASGSRPDIGNLYPAYGPNHGYNFLLQVAEGTHRVCVAVSNVGPGTSQALGCSTVTIYNNPIGALESATQVPGGIQVSGYAIDFNAAGPIAVRVYADGQYVAGATASATRADVAARYPTAGAGHGYTVTVPFSSGSHVLCVYGMNVGPGTVNTRFGCLRVAMQTNPVGTIEAALQYPGGVRVTGWALDPNTTAPVAVRIYADGVYVADATANGVRADVASSHPGYGASHGFVAFTPLSPGNHTVCLYGMNLGAGSNVRLKCVAVTRLTSPVGASAGIARVGISNTVQLSGWAVDPDQLGPVSVQITVDGVAKQTVTAGGVDANAQLRFPNYGFGHGYSTTITIDAAQHNVCVTALNVGLGSSVTLGCTLILTSGEGAPAPPVGLVAWPGSKQVTLSWTTPRSDNAAITGYILTINPGNHSVPVAAAATSVVSSGLTNGVGYTFTLRAGNSLGIGSSASATAVPTNIPPQVTPAPVSTSHYLRNLTGNLSSDAVMMRSMGAADASRNPSGHNYLILLQIGGQDETNHGALLSATPRFVSYPAVVSAVNAYLDGYATRQQPYAPLTLAIGTNNDVDVSAAAGISWARNVVNPVGAYAAARHAGVIVAGADDLEPGFSASVSASRSWLSGYLSATGARFVFNGSADGCSTVASGGACNNGWSMADLQWLSGGAAPGRIISLPQIYNYAMPQQWKYISLTGVIAGRARISFGGPLTEYTACTQAGSCGSIANTTAWQQLWSAISSNPAISQSQLPNGTDLRIN
jgi:hypothetical protein